MPKRKRQRRTPARVLYDDYPALHKRDGVVIEAGASDGYHEYNSEIFYKHRNWTSINIEPDPLYFKSLCRHRPETDRRINLNLALSDSVGEAEIASVGIKGLSTIDPLTLSNLQNSGRISDYTTHVTKTTTYSKLVKDLALTSVDLLVLDVEGHELNVIKGMEQTEILPEVIMIEWDKCPLAKISQALSKLKYKYVWHRNLFHNAFFVRVR